MFRPSLLSLLVLPLAALSVVARASSPSWELSSDSLAAPGLPSGWNLSGGEHLPPPDVVTIEIDGSPARVLSLPNEEDSSRHLDIPFPGFRDHQGPSPARLEIEIGAAEGEGRGLHWFLQRGDFDLRGDHNGVYLTGTDKHRVRIGAGTPPGRLTRVELAYDNIRNLITHATVDGVPAEAFSPLAVRNLNAPGRLRIIAATPSGKAVLVKRIAAWIDTGAAPRATGAPLPRWMTPTPADPADVPAHPLPTWTPLADAQTVAFTLEPRRLARPPFSGEVLLPRAAFARLPEALAADPALAAFWRGTENIARRLLADGNWSNWINPGEEGRYTYVVRGVIVRLALLHAATGEPRLGELIRLLTLDLARRPAPFWIHAELRPYDPAFTQGRLETAELARGLALTFQWTQDLFTEKEREEIVTALRDKGLDPSLRWLENPSPRNNFMAVIGGGALTAAKVLDDEPAAKLAIDVMQQWLGLVEDDGSYGEPVGYFEYGASTFFYGWWAQGREQGRALLRKHPSLRGTLGWIAAHYVVGHTRDGTPESRRINFGDDDVLKEPSPMVAESLAYALDDGTGPWLLERTGTRGLNAYEFLFRLGSLDDPLPPAQAPTLPTATIPDAGPAILRSGWTLDQDIVLALRGGGAARTGYSHDRGNRNAFMLFVDGELFFAAPGRSSYRSPLGNEWDRRIASHSGVSLDDKFQLRQRVARYTHFSDDGNLAQIASEAAESYHDFPESMQRRVWMDRKSGVIAIEDTILPSTPAIVGWHLLLANHDGGATLTPPAADAPQAGWRLRRPGGVVKFWIHTDRPATVSDRPGIMHTGYSYYPGDPGEGKPGSARHLTWTPVEGATRALRVWTLILTRADDSPDARAVFSTPDAGDPSWTLTRAGVPEKLVFPRGASSRP